MTCEPWIIGKSPYTFLYLLGIERFMTGVFPSILPSGDDFVDDSYSRQELEQKEYSELQSIAAQVESEDVHGRMSQEELINGLEGEQRV